MVRRRGFLIVMALLLSLLIIVVGLAYMGARPGEYAASQAAAAAVEARNLARAGLEDAKVKLSKDEFFPTGIGDEQVVFSYVEEMESLSEPGRVVGTYRVSIDRSYRSQNVIFIVAVGTAGKLKNPRARYSISAELNLEDFRFKSWNEGLLPPL
ncbi:MAG: hypothetical protein KC910_01735 [Candidatus Eremiobacteraeota bacterium]|nr:hypothetical protein [Candidatus Eremiobacteraeota bacterium]